MPLVLSAQALQGEQGDNLLFSQLSLRVNRGDIVHIQGANGCGKTTLLRFLAGLGEGVQGALCWGAELQDAQGRLARERLLYLGHKPSVTADLTLLENLQYLSALHHQHLPQQAVHFALEQVQLQAHQHLLVRQLSAGQQRRVALARLYLPLNPPCVWLLDEPFTSLDQRSTQHLLQRLRSVAEQGAAVILTAHQSLHGLASMSLCLDRPVDTLAGQPGPGQ